MPDPYEKNLIAKDFYFSKREIKMKIVAVLNGYLENRGLELIKPISRAFSKGTIIELIGTDETTATPGNKTEKIAYLCFAELNESGVLLNGDKLFYNGNLIGEIAGFDDTHMPNHQNTIVKMEKRISGKDIGLKVNEDIIINGF